MNTVVRIVAALLVAALLIIGIVNGCSRQELPDKKIDRVARILMHEPDRYTFLYRVPDSKELESMTIDHIINLSIIEDVPTNNEMWVNIKRHSGGGGRTRDEVTIDSVEIHIHGANDINGAGWNHGKFGRGQTTVVE